MKSDGFRFLGKHRAGCAAHGEYCVLRPTRMLNKVGAQIQSGGMYRWVEFSCNDCACQAGFLIREDKAVEVLLAAFGRAQK